MTTTGLAELVVKAQDGDREALEHVAMALQKVVYPLALRMTGSQPDAEDATQEILIKIVTRIGSFRGSAAVSTWAYRIAINHLLDRQKSRVELMNLTFTQFGEDLLDGLEAPPEHVDVLTVQAVKHACTLAMLTCLDRDHRVAYVLGDVFDLSGSDASALLAVNPAVYRQRLSRARRRLYSFTTAHCGLVNAAANCQCAGRASTAIRLGRVARPVPDAATVSGAVAEMERLHEAATLMRWEPNTPPPAQTLGMIRRLVNSNALARPARPWRVARQ